MRRDSRGFRKRFWNKIVMFWKIEPFRALKGKRIWILKTVIRIAYGRFWSFRLSTKGIRNLEKVIQIVWKYFSYWKMDSNRSTRDSNRLKIFWLLENGFESLKEGFESLRYFFTSEKLFWKRDSNSWRGDSNRLTQNCMNAPENTRKCSTNTQFHSSFTHII